MVTGANGTGKSSVYRALRLLADCGRGEVIGSLAREGGLESVLWAGPEQLGGARRTGHGAGHHPHPACLARTGLRLRRLRLSRRPRTAQDGRPQIVVRPRSRRSSARRCSPGPVMRTGLDAGAPQPRLCRGGRGVRPRLRPAARRRCRPYRSVLAEYAHPGAHPELAAVRDRLARLAVLRRLPGGRRRARRGGPSVGTRTPVLSDDGGDLAAAVQTIIEAGFDDLPRAVADAFDGATVSVAVHDGLFELAAAPARHVASAARRRIVRRHTAIPAVGGGAAQPAAAVADGAQRAGDLAAPRPGAARWRHDPTPRRPTRRSSWSRTRRRCCMPRQHARGRGRRRHGAVEIELYKEWGETRVDGLDDAHRAAVGLGQAMTAPLTAHRFRPTVNRCSPRCRSIRRANHCEEEHLDVGEAARPRRRLCARRRRGCSCLRAAAAATRRSRTATRSVAPRRGDLRPTAGPPGSAADQTDAIRDAINASGAKNVILLIGDGMGDSEITLARNYEKGAGGFFAGIDALPLTGSYTTYALKKDGKPDYVTDSAASAHRPGRPARRPTTAPSASTSRANRRRRSWSWPRPRASPPATSPPPRSRTPHRRLCSLTSPSADCYGPEETAKDCADETLEKGGQGSVTEQLLAARPDVTMGGGAETFAQTATGGEYKGKPLEVQAKERGYQIVRTADELAGITKADQDAPLLGLFADGNMPVSWAGPAAVRQGYLQPAAKCTDNPEHGSAVPKLAAMTTEGDRSAVRQREAGRTRASSFRWRARRSTSATTPPIRAGRSARRSSSTRR